MRADTSPTSLPTGPTGSSALRDESAGFDHPLEKGWPDVRRFPLHRIRARAGRLIPAAGLAAAVLALAGASSAEAQARAQGSPSAVAISFTLDRASLGTAPGTVVVSGTVTCSGPVSQAWGGGNVSQARGLTTVSADFSLDAQPCSGTPHAWVATTHAASRDFLPKAATVTVGFVACDENRTCTETPVVTRRLRLQRVNG